MDFSSNPPPHLADSGYHSNTPAWWNFEFPNGYGANVWLSRWPFRFDVELDVGFEEADGMVSAEGLTSEELEAKLTEVAGRPARDVAA